eukprot:CAMPEP_0198285602 /NCGR_PEP_ID=MMETSP1449-20131203/4855_1 /TAXON_ID=420275 /ORGANISM="Attheya septentrionalis, Strain CCMP2084" /LENGTH=203 /DNA_ID=CAMNT_0043983075 /DNA_START=189 /DNA_END=800 /DNA_ORIENTATION=+
MGNKKATCLLLVASAASSFVVSGFVSSPQFGSKTTGKITHPTLPFVGVPRSLTTGDDLDETAPTEFDIHELMDEEPPKDISQIEKTWRYAKKPLISIGGKGFSPTHGNSLRQLLDAHTVVKVKFNTKNDTLEECFQKLRDLAVEAGADEEMELIKIRDSEKVILFGKPGTMERIKSGEFPPKPKPWIPKPKEDRIPKEDRKEE